MIFEVPMHSTSPGVAYHQNKLSYNDVSYHSISPRESRSDGDGEQRKKGYRLGAPPSSKNSKSSKAVHSHRRWDEPTTTTSSSIGEIVGWFLHSSCSPSEGGESGNLRSIYLRRWRLSLMLATDLFHRRELPVHFRLILLSQGSKAPFNPYLLLYFAEPEDAVEGKARWPEEVGCEEGRLESRLNWVLDRATEANGSKCHQYFPPGMVNRKFQVRFIIQKDALLR